MVVAMEEVLIEELKATEGMETTTTVTEVLDMEQIGELALDEDHTQLGDMEGVAIPRKLWV